MRISNISQQVAKFDCRTIVGHRFYYYQIVATLLNKNMATLKLCIVPAKVLINGKHKVRISLAHNSNTRYIPTNCIIDTPSQFKEGQVINHPEAASMNMKLRNLLNHYQNVIDNIYDVDVYSCSELREIIIKRKTTPMPSFPLQWHLIYQSL